MKSFNCIFVREKSGKDFVLENYNLNSRVVLDPTFLLNKEYWIRFSNKASIKYQNYVLIYVMETCDNLINSAIKYAFKHNLDMVILGNVKKFECEDINIHWLDDLDPYEFVNYIANASTVFTTSFHGMCFSINLNIEFYFELSNQKRNNNFRLIDLSKKFNLQSQEIYSDNLKENKINWCKVNDILELEREKSVSLLKNSISHV